MPPVQTPRRAPRLTFSAAELTGQSAAHVVDCPGFAVKLHRRVVRPFLELRRAAARDGLDLAPASGYRDFARQVAIWNDKWTGRRPLVGRDGRRLEAAALSPRDRVEAILVWSAAPGASRHHWGTDLDVYDRAAVAPGYRLGLTAEEYAPGGPFARLTDWLDEHMARFGFYRPYQRDRGGVLPEPWHLSHWPTAVEASRRLRPSTLRAALAAAPLEGRAALLARLEWIYPRYVRNVERPPRG